MDKPCVFLDLDDTLFQSRRKFAVKDQAALGQSENVGAVGPDGKPNAFMRPSQRALLDWLSACCHLIPTTCRGLAQFRRTMIKSFDHAILYCGGMILDSDGNPDADWNERMESQLCQSRALLSEAEMIARRRLDGRTDALIRRMRHQDTCFYVHAKVRSGNTEQINGIAEELTDPRFDGVLRVHQHDANLFLMPCCVDKRFAVSHLMESMSASILTIGIGDAASDFGFMDLCDFAMMPTESQLWQALAGRVRSGGEVYR